MPEIMWAFCRTDYPVATPGIAGTARKAEVYKARRFSGHAPLTVDYAWSGFDPAAG